MKLLLRYKWPIIFAVTGTVLLVLAVVKVITLVSDSGIHITGPGETTINIAQPGKYTLWHESRTFLDGRFLTFEDELPSGASISIRNSADGTTVPLRGAGTSSIESGGTRRVSVARLDFDEPGEYDLQISGLTQQRVFYLAEARFWKVFQGVIGFGIPGILLVLAAIGSGIYILVRARM